ncbi:hypothetical protein evm_000602 [Chilo suppressalis]|nr:hypothetical protein evm_009567 [Chilo suppressalis]RVE54835.1 hypothetical protein evm_000602 [Chilo suppressalis]
MFPKVLIAFYTQIDKALKESGALAGKSGRHMKFPYTLSAKIAQFPFLHYTKHNFIWMYYPVGILVSSYFFFKIHLLSNSESNKRSWAEIQRKAAEKEHH